VSRESHEHEVGNQILCVNDLVPKEEVSVVSDNAVGCSDRGRVSAGTEVRGGAQCSTPPVLVAFNLDDHARSYHSRNTFDAAEALPVV
jgi:hypothetical protein